MILFIENGIHIYVPFNPLGADAAATCRLSILKGLLKVIVGKLKVIEHALNCFELF